jgi:hypothetical protein
LQTLKWEDNVVPQIGPPPQTVVDRQMPPCDVRAAYRLKVSPDNRA